MTTWPDEIKSIRACRGSRCDYESTRITKNHDVLEEVEVKQVRGRRDLGLGLATPKKSEKPRDDMLAENSCNSLFKFLVASGHSVHLHCWR